MRISMLITFIFFGLVWLILTQGDLRDWPLALLFILAATYLSQRLTARKSINTLAWLKFIPWFLWRSLHSGIDIAARTLARPPRIDPGLLCYPLRLQGDSARIFLAGCISLIPGTLTAKLEDDHLVLHLIDCSEAMLQETCNLEQHIGPLFNQIIEERTS